MAGGARDLGRSVTSRVLAILGAFDAHHPRLTLTEIAGRTGMALSTVHRLVAELEEWRALRRGADGRYQIGRRLWELGQLVPDPLQEVAHPWLQELFGGTGENVHLAVRDGVEVLYVDKVYGKRAVPIVSRTGSRRLGVRVFEHTPVRSLHDDGVTLELDTPKGRVRAGRVALGTGAFPPLLRRLRHFLVPVYDYALMTEPVPDDLLAEVGWRNRQGIGDSANRFHYYRLTDDNRILWGGYDAVYHNGGLVKPEYDQRDATFEKLATHFFETFPQLHGLRFTHKWGGVIDTCSRFSAFFGTAYGSRLAYAAGYTGLGVGATRFGANVMLDLLQGRVTERTDLRMVRQKPMPFPPEPVRSGVIQLTRWAIARADEHEGRRNAWLRTLDAFGVGFDS